MANDICYVCGTHNMRGSVCLTCCPDGDPRLKPVDTRSAPAATDTELVTVEYQVRSKLNGHWVKDNFLSQQLSPDTERRELVPRSQAEELLAAERAEKARLKLENEAQADQINELEMTPWPEWASKVLAVIRKRSGYDGYDDTTEGVDLPAELDECIAALEADNAALTARVKELEADLKTYQDDTTDEINEKIDLEFRVVDLEAKLAAAEKALEGIASFKEKDGKDAATREWNRAGLYASEIARAALEVKP